MNEILERLKSQQYPLLTVATMVALATVCGFYLGRALEVKRTNEMLARMKRVADERREVPPEAS